MAVTLKDIAQEAGTTVMTVSNVINGRYGKVSQATVYKVRAIAEKLDYVPSATARRPEPQSWLMPKAVRSTGMPAATAACRAGFCPAPAVRIWPMMTSSTSSGFTPARSIAALMATVPSVCAGIAAKALSGARP